MFSQLANDKNIAIGDDDVLSLFSSLDLNGSGLIDYTEFLAAFTQNEIYQSEKYLKEVFNRIDKVIFFVILKKSG